MKRILIVIAAATVAALTPTATPAAGVAGSGEVTSWIEVTLGEIAAHRTNPPQASRVLALLSVAMAEAASAGSPAAEAAVAGAASTVLAHVYPDGSGRFHGLANARAGAGGRGGFALGAATARDLIAARADDGSAAVWSGTVPVGAGLWVPTPPAFVYPPLEPMWGSVRPWNLAAPLLAPPPPPFGSAQYEAEVKGVYDVSQALTAEQEAIAQYWADGAGTVTPPGHWNQIAIGLVEAQPLSASTTARIFAVLNTAQADAFISCWATKYTYWTERPVTAIQRELDAGWRPVIATPPFPSYISGHATTSSAAAEVLAHFFPARAGQLRGWAEEAAVSRLYGGIHFRSDNDAGLELGREVAAAALVG